MILQESTGFGSLDAQIGEFLAQCLQVGANLLLVLQVFPNGFTNILVHCVVTRRTLVTVHWQWNNVVLHWLIRMRTSTCFQVLPSVSCPSKIIVWDLVRWHMIRAGVTTTWVAMRSPNFLRSSISMRFSTIFTHPQSRMYIRIYSTSIIMIRIWVITNPLGSRSGLMSMIMSGVMTATFQRSPSILTVLPRVQVKCGPGATWVISKTLFLQLLNPVLHPIPENHVLVINAVHIIANTTTDSVGNTRVTNLLRYSMRNWNPIHWHLWIWVKLAVLMQIWRRKRFLGLLHF